MRVYVKMDDSSPGDAEINKRVIRDKLSKIEASDIFVPRSEVILLNIDSTFDEMLSAVIADGHSRYPVFSEKIDNIVGFLYVKDLLPLINNPDARNDSVIRKLARKPLFISENKKLSDLFSEFINTHVHMAIVVDEYGSFIGLITLEDILEQIVGDISDEYDKAEEAYYKAISDKETLIYPKMPIDEFNKLFRTRIQSEDYDTIGGFVIDRFGYVPKVDEKLKYKNLEFIISKAEGSRILEIRVVRK